MVDALDKKETILMAAIEIFSKKGFHKTKVEEIALAAGIGKGTVYEYFKSKKELFQEIFIWFLSKYQNTIQNKITPNMTPKEALIIILKIQLEFFWSYKDISVLIMNEYKELDSEFIIRIHEEKKKNLYFVVNCIDKGIKEGFFRQVNPFTAALVLEGSIHSVIGMAVFSGNSLDESVFSELQTIIFNGLEP